MRIPLITEIQRFSLQDGPGIRTTLFVKGCPLHCPWCHNPESQAPGPELLYHADRCSHCLSCVEVCSSGGEPLMFADFTRFVSAALKGNGIHVAMETCACVKGRSLTYLADTVDLFIVDLKTLNPDRHQEVVGGSLELVLNNIAGLIDRGAPFRIHIPVIPGFNDSLDDYHRFARYLGEIAPHVNGVDILPYHCYGESKYAALGRKMNPDFCPSQDMPSQKVMPLVSLLKSRKVSGVTIGGMIGVNKGERSIG